MKTAWRAFSEWDGANAVPPWQNRCLTCWQSQPHLDQLQSTAGKKLGLNPPPGEQPATIDNKEQHRASSVLNGPLGTRPLLSPLFPDKNLGDIYRSASAQAVLMPLGKISSAPLESFPLNIANFLCSIQVNGRFCSAHFL